MDNGKIEVKDDDIITVLEPKKEEPIPKKQRKTYTKKDKAKKLENQLSGKFTDKDYKNDAKFCRGLLQATFAPTTITQEQIENGEIPIIDQDTLFDVWEHSLYSTLKKYNYTIPCEGVLAISTALIVTPTLAQLIKYYNIGEKLKMWGSKTIKKSKSKRSKKGFWANLFNSDPEEDGKKDDKKTEPDIQQENSNSRKNRDR